MNFREVKFETMERIKCRNLSIINSNEISNIVSKDKVMNDLVSKMFRDV